MEFGSINILVQDPEKALETYLKLFGTNNIEQVIKLKGLNDTVDVIDGYYLKTEPIHVGLFKPRNKDGRMGAALEKYGEGIHHIELHLKHDEFEEAYVRLKKQGLPVSDKVIYIGKFSEPMFWLDGSGGQGVPIKFTTKAQRLLSIWEDTVYLDTPQKFETVTINAEHIRPGVTVKTIMVTITGNENDLDRQIKIWENIVSRKAKDIGNISTNERKPVDDFRGNIFVPVRFQFSGGGGINLYVALNPEGPINKEIAHRGVRAMYNNAAGYIVRDKVHECWKQWEENGFAMLDPKPKLNTDGGNGNYFFFIHPISTHGVLWEFVSLIDRDEETKASYNWSGSTTYMVSP